MANRYFQRLNDLASPPFRIDLVGITTDPVVYQGVFSVQPTTSIDQLNKSDLIIVSPISGNLENGIEVNRPIIEWIREQRIANSAQIASLCKGAFLLAETGLLNGKKCATHWTAHNAFRLRYPEVELMPEKIICEEDGIYSSGGAYSILNFILYLIERLYGRETAIWCSKLSEIEFDRLSQQEFIVFSGQKEHGDEAILKAQEFIESHYTEKISIDSIALQLQMNGRSFLRRFKKATANTPLEYLQRVRVEAAKRHFESTTKTVSEVMYGLGYNDEKAFRTLFKKHVGVSPMAYQRKYNREISMA
jgi:transcriptional regulator GlxA family with amidase domain